MNTANSTVKSTTKSTSISTLYSPDKLFSGFTVSDVGSYANTLDARTYLNTKVDQSENARMRRAVHDQRLTNARDHFVASKQQPVVAIMGGHAEPRDGDVYRTVAHIAHRLSQRFLLTSGGGPGAMEATHLGALVQSPRHLDQCIEVLATSPQFPHGLNALVSNDDFNQELLTTLHHWQVPAFEVLESIPTQQRRQSLAIPTWFYGHEPPTPLATHIAKYFMNAIREDGLLAIADAGIVYAPGKAGTVQEVFQDAAQNYYESFGRFSPMAFLDVDGYWTSQLPVEHILRPLFGDEKYARWVLISPDPDEIIHFLSREPHTN